MRRTLTVKVHGRDHRTVKVHGHDYRTATDVPVRGRPALSTCGPTIPDLSRLPAGEEHIVSALRGLRVGTSRSCAAVAGLGLVRTVARPT